ncbi:MAG: aspartate aminotransferase family protein [Clostridia bacterium]|nr:aspartate aminotransferase family protein [Clostridia bacterium]
MKAFEEYESQVRSYCRKFETVFVRSKDAKQYDEDGREYIDFFMGAGALNYGHNNDYIKEKLIKYLMDDGVTHAMDMYTKPKREFIEYFEEKILAPRGLDYKIMFPGPTGTNSVETALKLARKVTGRQTVFAFMGCFHGMSLGSLSLTTEEAARKGAGVPLNNVVHIPAPYMFPGLDVLNYIDTLITHDHSGVEKPAAIFIETLQAEGGIYAFSNEFLKGLRELCDKHEILLVVDDVQTGCGRTGYFFSFERAGIVPDIVCMSKSIGGYGTPFALTLFKRELDIWNPGEHNGTFRGFQLSIVAAKAALELAVEKDVPGMAKSKETFMRNFLETEMGKISPEIEVRGMGLMWGCDFGKFPKGTVIKIIHEAFDNGLIFEAAGREDCVAKLMPSLMIDQETLEKGLSIFVQAVKTVLGK